MKVFFFFRLVGVGVILSFLSLTRVSLQLLLREKGFVIEDFLLICGLWDDQVSQWCMRRVNFVVQMAERTG